MRTKTWVGGFTLLELLVAAALSLLLVGLMLGVTRSALGLWARTQGQDEQTASARQVFALLERDLQAALHQPDAGCWLAVDILDSSAAVANHGWLLEGAALTKPGTGGSLQPLTAPEPDGSYSIHAARFGLSGAWLRFVTSNVESGGTLPTVVAWQLVRRPVTGDPLLTNPAPVRYSLFRSAVSPLESFNNGYDVTATAYGSGSNTPSSALSTAYRQSRNVTNPSQANLIAGNVLDFGCWLHVRDAAGRFRRIYPADAADVSHHALGNGTSDGTRMPAVVDVLIRITSEEGTTQLAAMEAGMISRPAEFATDAAWWWAVAEAHSRVFIQRFEIKGAAP